MELLKKIVSMTRSNNKPDCDYIKITTISFNKSAMEKMKELFSSNISKDIIGSAMSEDDGNKSDEGNIDE